MRWWRLTPPRATECLAELFDPADRRYRYPFINCTNCGPRFTIVRGVPYDRPLTTMAGFEMCAQCRAEYESPRDRRFHAQPIACPECGPVATLVDATGTPCPPAGGDDAVAAAAQALGDGAIVAVKGIGGFHLACRADDERAVAALRARKHREEKPFALMVRDLDEAARFAVLEAHERELLLGPERPIVLAPRRAGAPVAPSVAPCSPELGLMLPYSPLHHLLLADTDAALVMTSGNVSDEPIAYEDDEALARLGTIADLFLLHDRPIETRTDDSVARAVSLGTRRRPLLLRRSRGHVPESIELPIDCDREVLGCGAELKSTFCLVKGGRAWVGHHIGDLENYETLRSYREGIAHFERLFAIEPEVLAHDLHPEYLSTKYASEREADAHVGVQHHHAHLAACLAEHGETQAAVGAIYDGTGYGTDGTIWGGELLVGDLAGFERVAHLWPVRMPGGTQAIREPWRMACAWIAAAAARRMLPPRTLAEHIDAARWRQVSALTGSATFAPLTTSIGRLFDAVSALCGLRPWASYEGQAAFELEAAADRSERGAYPLPLADGVPGRAGDGPRGARRPRTRAPASRRSRPDSTTGSPGAPPPPAPRPRREAEQMWSSCQGACSRTDCWSSARPHCSATPACACWCRSGCLPTTAASRSDRRRWQRLVPAGAIERCSDWTTTYWTSGRAPGWCSRWPSRSCSGCATRPIQTT